LILQREGNDGGTGISDKYQKRDSSQQPKCAEETSKV
jgi:hypothetical protein